MVKVLYEYMCRYLGKTTLTALILPLLFLNSLLSAACTLANLHAWIDIWVGGWIDARDEIDR